MTVNKNREQHPTNKTPKWKPIKAFFSITLLLTVILLIHFWIGWDTLIEPWYSMDPLELFTVLLLLFLTYLLRAIRITQFFKLTSMSAFLASAKIMILHNFWNNLLPMRSGEASFPILMKSQLHIPLSQSLPALFWFRLLDLQVILLIGLLAFSSLWLTSSWILALGLIGVSAPFIAYWLNQAWLKPKLVSRETNGLLLKLSQGMPSHLSQVFWSWVWTLINWSLKIAVLVWAFSWLFAAPLSNLTMGVLGGELSSVLPIHGIGGFGSYEAGILIGFMDFEVDQTKLLAAAVNIHLIVLGSSIIAALFALWIRKQPIDSQNLG